MSERARGRLHVHYFLRLDVQSAFCTSVGGHFQPPGQVPQNGLFDGISAQFGSFAADLALVPIFSLLECTSKQAGLTVQVVPCTYKGPLLLAPP